MPEIRHYKITAEVSFDLSASVAYHEAVRMVEERLSAALKSEDRLNHLENGKITSVDVVDERTGKARYATGGHR